MQRYISTPVRKEAEPDPSPKMAKTAILNDISQAERLQKKKEHKAEVQAARQREIQISADTLEEKRERRARKPQEFPLSAYDADRLRRLEKKLAYKFSNSRLLYVATYCKKDLTSCGILDNSSLSKCDSNMEAFATLGDSILDVICNRICLESGHPRGTRSQSCRSYLAKTYSSVA